MKIPLYALLVVGICFVNSSFAKDDEKDSGELLKNDVQAAVNTLNSNHPFIYFDLHLSKNEVNTLKSLKINSTEEYNNYGNLKALESEVKKFIQSLGNEEKAARVSSQIIGKIIVGILQGSEQETAWVAVRSFIPTPEYDIPRWHTDGYYYEPYEGNPYKFAITLKGAPTLFYKLPLDKRKAFSTLQDKGNEQNEFNRQAIATLLGGAKEAIPMTQPHQGAVFIVGSDHAAVHSEPPIKKERIFISILPGSKAQIKEWKDKQG